MCCDYGEGTIAVYATVDGIDEILISSDGSFDASDNKAFTVPESYTRGAKTGTKVSIDSDEDQQFHVDDKVGNKGCQWLSMSMDRFDYMCEFIDVASIYP
jgi:hypothetical protein